MHCDYNTYSITPFYRHSYQLASLPITFIIDFFVVLFSSFSFIRLFVSTVFFHPYHHIRRRIAGRDGVRYYEKGENNCKNVAPS